MIKALKSIGVAMMAIVSTTSVHAATSTLTNVLQNISLQLTIYEQDSTNSAGTKITAKPVSYSTKNLIAALQGITGQAFGPTAKLVQNTVFSNVTITNFSSNNLTLLLTNGSGGTNNTGCLDFGGSTFCNGTNILIISNNAFISGGPTSSVSTNVVTDPLDTNSSVSFITNAGYETTFIPSVNVSNAVTGFSIVSQRVGKTGLTETVFTNVSSLIEVLYGKTNTLYPVSSYFIFSTNSPIIVTETGAGLNTNNPVAPSISSQSGYSISNLVINYFAPLGSTNLSLNLEGFVKQALKIDVFSRQGTNIVLADLFGASSTWNVIGSGYTGGNFTTNGGGIFVTNLVDGVGVGGFLTNTSPVVVQGTINISFLKNLAQ